MARPCGGHRDSYGRIRGRCSDGPSLDFGTARDLGRTQKDRMAAKTRVYTEGYAPPEQIIGKPEPRSDLFALAGTLYHLTTGKSPEGFYTARELEEQLADPSSALPATARSTGVRFALGLNALAVLLLGLLPGPLLDLCARLIR